MKKHVIYLLVLGVILMNACQKEVSFEAGKNRSHGSLQSDATGDCLPKTVNGVYAAGKKLSSDTNTITVNVNVTTAGSYNISTDTVNGYYFRATGIFAAQGTTTVTLKGNGTPLLAGTDNFVISYDSSECDIVITVLPAGAGGPASYTLANTTGSCTSTVNGTYILNTALTTANTVDLAVNVTTIGTYSITTGAVGGMTFAATGTFASPGPNTITLKGTGTPTTSGSNTIPITTGTSSCSFIVNVVGASVGTLGATAGACTPATPAGTYTVGTALTTGNTVLIQVNITTIGGYTITTNTVNGISFLATGNFATTGVQNVTLNGNGTPTASGTQTFTVTYGTSTCTFSINVVAAGVSDYYPRTTNSNWSYEVDDDPDDSLLIKVIPNTLTVSGNLFNIFMETDDASGGFDSSGYYRKSSNDYFQWLDASLTVFDNPAWTQITFLKDNVAAGGTWNSSPINGTVGGIPISIRLKYTILQKDVPVSVTTSTGMASYPNTIVVKEELEQLAGSIWTSLTPSAGYNKNYYSRNIGFILQEYFNGTGALSGKFALRRYVVF